MNGNDSPPAWLQEVYHPRPTPLGFASRGKNWKKKSKKCSGGGIPPQIPGTRDPAPPNLTPDLPLDQPPPQPTGLGTRSDTWPPTRPGSPCRQTHKVKTLPSRKLLMRAVIMNAICAIFWRKETVYDVRTCKILAWYQEFLCQEEYFLPKLRLCCTFRLEVELV